jgi:hypothetical protein
LQQAILTKAEERKRKDSHVDDVINSVIERGIAESKHFEMLENFEFEKSRNPAAFNLVSISINFPSSSNKQEHLSLASLVSFCLLFPGKIGAYLSREPFIYLLLGRLLALPTSIKLSKKEI